MSTARRRDGCRYVAVAQSQVNAADAAVGVAETGVATAEAGVANAEAAIVQAQPGLDLARGRRRPEDVAVAEAAVAQARAGLDAATATMAQAELAAPFDGTVSAVWHRAGEMVQSGQDVLALGDPDAMRVETPDLRETDVGRLQIGQKVDVTFDALPIRAFEGTITRIARWPYRQGQRQLHRDRRRWTMWTRRCGGG